MRVSSLTLVLWLTGASSTAHLVAAQTGAGRALPAYADRDHVVYTLPRGIKVLTLPKNLAYHGGPVLTSAKVVFIFWGPSFSDPLSPDYDYAQTLQQYRDQLGTTPEYNVVTQYSGIGLSNLAAGTADAFDPTTPPTEVTDAIVRGRVRRYLVLHPFSEATVYELVLPATSYSSSGSSTSCGGPSPAYCAYHGWIDLSSTSAIKYSVQPYPSCSDCRVSGWTAVENQEHFVVHETREAVTNPTGTAWYDIFGREADDKCAWNPAPFIGTGGYAYQYEWSNATQSCVKTLP